MPLIAALMLAASPSCPTPAPLSAPWTAWNKAISANASAAATAAPAIAVGQSLDAILRPAADLRYAAAPAKGAGEGYGGLFTLVLPRPAKVGVALSGPAWIDVVSGEKAATSIEHGHGPDCSGIRKIVWFDLPAGRQLVQIAGAKETSIRVMAALRDPRKK